MNKYIPPAFELTSFNCPHDKCGVFAKQFWTYADTRDMEMSKGGLKPVSYGSILDYAFSKCDHCNKFSVWDLKKKTLIHPRISRNFDTTDVPEPLVLDYNEACLVIYDSPKASATLSRRCLQAILNENGFSDRDLSKGISKAIESNKLTQQLAEDLDYVRIIGNFAAHPKKDSQTGEIVEVEIGEAEWNIEVLEALFEFFYKSPARAKRKKEEFNAKFNIKPS